MLHLRPRDNCLGMQHPYQEPTPHFLEHERVLLFTYPWSQEDDFEKELHLTLLGNIDVLSLQEHNLTW